MESSLLNNHPPANHNSILKKVSTNWRAHTGNTSSPQIFITNNDDEINRSMRIGKIATLKIFFIILCSQMNLDR